MYYRSCHWINNGIEFRTDSIRLCCFGYLQGDETSDQTVLKSDYHGELPDWDEIFKIKNKLRNMHRNGQYLDACKNCIYLEDAHWHEEDFINHFTLNYWTKCNCNCNYCYTYNDKKNFNSFENYNILPIIKDMFEKGIIKYPEEGCVSFGGGEATILEEFDELIDLLLDNGFKNIRINTSGIKYSKSIERGLKQGKISVVISTDAGYRETYEKIKGVKTYDTVMRNISEYAKAANSGKLLKVKYIVIPGVNDNYKEIDKWFEEVIKSGAKGTSVSVEQHWFQENMNKYNPDINEKIEYIIKRSEEAGLDMEVYCEAIALLEKNKDRI